MSQDWGTNWVWRVSCQGRREGRVVEALHPGQTLLWAAAAAAVEPPLLSPLLLLPSLNMPPSDTRGLPFTIAPRWLKWANAVPCSHMRDVNRVDPMLSLTSGRVMPATMAFEFTSGVSPRGGGGALERKEAWARVE